MSLTSVIGQPLAVELAQRWLSKGTTHPLLFYGPDGTGKRTLAREMAKALNCQAKKPFAGASTGGRRGKPVALAVVDADAALAGDACDQCLACKKVASNQHPDVRLVDLAFQAAQREEPVEKQQSLRIETILEERRRLFQSAVEGVWKVMIIDDAHRLTPDAANVLLKVLEEPPERTAIFLLTPFRDRLFATILSRCQPLRLKPLSDDEMQQVLGNLGIEAGSQLRLVELALGSPGRALHMSRDEQIQGLLEAEALWQALPGQTPSRIMNRGEGRSKATRPGRPEIEEKLHWLLLPASRALRSGDTSAAGSVRLIQEALQKLRQNVQPSLVFEHLLLQLAQQRKANA